MEVGVAYALLGIADTATYEQARTAYRARAKLLHPDRAGADEAQAAADAMAQLTEAWDTVRTNIASGRHNDARNRTTGTTRTNKTQGPSRHYRSPNATECVVCGRGPATPLTLRRTTGLIIFWRLTRYEFTTCRDCARSLYAEIQASSLVRGWWGIVAPIANIFNLARNRAALSQHTTETDFPRPVDPAVMPMGDPLPYRSPWGRPGSLIATAVAVIAVTLVANAAITNLRDSTTYTGRGGPGTTPPLPTEVAVYQPQIGDCISSTYTIVDCGDTTATWRLDAQATDANECAAEGFDDALTSQDNGTVWCVDRMTPS